MAKRKIRILIIDDEEDFCFLIKSNLESIGNYKVNTAKTCKKGMWAARWHKPDLILLDIMMPGIGGLEVLRRLKKSNKTRNIPIIMLTAVANTETEERAFSLHCDGYIVKPIKIEELISKLEKMLSKSVRKRKRNKKRPHYPEGGQK